MLISFTVANFRSYFGAKEFSLSASRANELPQNVRELPNLGLSVLPVAVIYGANASGKSNLLRAMTLLSDMLDAPTTRPLLGRYPVFQPFALAGENPNRSTNFDVKFLVDGVLYEYAISFTVKRVVREMLTAYPLGRPQMWFRRGPLKFEFGQPYLKGPKNSLATVTPPAVPFLATAAAFDHQQLSPPARWLATNLRDRVGAFPRRPGVARQSYYESPTMRLLRENPDFKGWASNFLRFADLGISSVETHAFKVGRAKQAGAPFVTQSVKGSTMMEFIEEGELHEPVFIHTGKEGATARFPLEEESSGTRRLFVLLGPLYEVLSLGQVAVIDELSECLHPSMVNQLIRIFHDPKLNPKCAQLIFATHDTALLSGRHFRRDQVWFTEKNSAGATDLYSLHDVKGVREEEAIEKGYLRGRYGAIPFFGRFDFPPTLQSSNEENEESDAPSGYSGKTGSP